MIRRRQYFLHELARSNRPLLLLISIWLTFAAFSAWTKMEATPVHMWNMFAVPLKEKPAYTVTTLYADGDPVGDPAAWHYFCNMVREHSLAHYLRLCDSCYIPPGFHTIKAAGNRAGLNMNDFTARVLPGSTALAQYPEWLKRYISAQSGRQVKNLCLVARTVAYSDSGKLQLLSSRIIFAR
jgi:hypothetical protein